MSSILRQLKDIQNEADKLIKGSPNVMEIENFSRYSNEIKDFIERNIEFPEVLKLVEEIPDIPMNKVTIKTGLMSLIIPKVLLYWYHERVYISVSTSKIEISRGKFASLEFILKNYF